MRRALQLALPVVFLAGVGFLAWRIAGLPPVGFVLRYGLSWGCEPTGETVTIEGLADVKPRQKVIAKVTYADGTVKDVPLICRIDTADELDYVEHGGILHYVLRDLAA